MQRFWFIFLLLVSVPLSAIGQSSPPIEFVEGLRNRGMAGLALEYLQRISENPPAELRDRISLELAKTNLILALQEDDDRQRDLRWDQAERAYEKYLASPIDPLAGADVNLDLARLLTRRARLRMIVDPTSRNDSKATRQAFDSAGRRIRTALEQLKSVNPTATQQQQLVANRIAEAKLEEQMTRLHRAATMEGEQRLRELEHIRVSFETLAAEYAGQTTGWIAKVMVGRCWMDLDNPFEARKQFEEIALQGSKVSPEAIRLNRFYQVLLLSQDANNRNNLSDTVRGCEEWLAMFPLFMNSEEGQGIRVVLVKALIAQLGPMEAGTKVPPGTRAVLQRAERLVRDIANQIGPYAYPARLIRSDVAQLMAGEQLFGGIGNLESFEEAHLVAQGAAIAARRGKNPEEQAARYRRAAIVLERGLQMATSNDSRKDIVDAQLMLAYLLLISGDNHSAAVLGEYISTSNMSSSGAQGLAYAISADANLLSASRATLAAIEDIQADENRLRLAAEQMLTKWPEDPAADVARFHLGVLHLEAQRYVAAFDQFITIRDSFPGCCEARYRAGIAARMIQATDVAMDAKAKAVILARAIDGLKRLSLQSDTGGEDGFVGMCQAKLQLGTLLLFSEQSQATFVEMRRIGEAVQAAVGERLTTHLARPRLESEAERLILSGIIGESYLLVQQGRFDEAHTMLIPYATVIERSVKQWSQFPQLQENWFQSLMAARRDLVLLYLRACVNGDRISRVSEALSCLRAMPAIGGQDGYRCGLLNIVTDLKRDLELVRLTKSESRERGLVIGLTAVLDEFKRAEELTPEQRIFVAQANSAVHRHDKATTFLTSVLEGKEDPQQDNTYRFARLVLAREYRLAGDYAKAKALMREILGTPAKKGWGFDNLDVRKEAIALMQDEQNWAGGNRMAVEMQHRLLPVVEEYAAKSAQLLNAQSEKKTEEAGRLEADLQRLKPQREAFFEFYHLELRGIVKNTQEDKDGKSTATLERVAVRIAKLERTHPDLGGVMMQTRFRTLINSEPALKSRYLSEGGALLNEK